MQPTPEVPVMALVVDRRSGRVIDCQSYTYGPYLSELCDRHDLTEYDIIIRASISTAPPDSAAALDYEPGESEFSTVEKEAPMEPKANPDEDIPF